ncbi:MAG: LytTR family DNA-binding domain-containing protein [Ruminococcus sp.]|nr:LytTR family DNA-binding domain-containing protein [Ruminococcus sp.]
MKIAICDDESYWRENLSILLEKYGKKRHIDIVSDYFSNGASLLESSKEFDIVFMDYQMSDINGIETVRKIRQKNKKCAVIFVSAFPAVALDTFALNTFRFLAKPIDSEKLFDSLDDYLRYENENYIYFNTHNGLIKIREADILYCESSGRHTIVHTPDKDYTFSLILKEIEKQLSREKFIRCHKAYIVAFAHIKSFDNTSVILDNNASVYIGRTYLSDFKTVFQNYIISNNLRRI